MLCAFELHHNHVAVIRVGIDGLGSRWRELEIAKCVREALAQPAAQARHAIAGCISVVHHKAAPIKVSCSR